MKDELKDLEPASWSGSRGARGEAGGDEAPWFNLISKRRVTLQTPPSKCE